ncbi:hypothetical protein R3W88_025847 [Solanum pinnatisectum]|uniref:S-protein homolog n=1 Tax=Solanum pinnatisectum TaxID=50273 RepID=A0AAV9M7K3_9SOLN|nr:hypothetical protein R3W88_025847 [Solanum pinnatisectum]
MDYSQIKTILLLCIFLFFCFPQAKGSRKYTICVYNSLPVESPDKLRVHCFSKDDDIGFHVLSPYEDINWSFQINHWIFARTTFFCSFWWGKKAQAFIVFDDENICISDSQLPQATDYCQWTAQEDGIYLSGEQGYGYKYSSW